MKITLYHVDVFTPKLFSGNPAAVCILEKWLSDAVLQNLAAENNLPATAFLVYQEGKFNIRWFAPDYEIDLCGHGTLASGFVILNIIEPTWDHVNLYHPIVGLLRIERQNQLISLDLPIKNIETYPSPALLTEGLGIKSKEIYQYKKERILVVLETENEVRQLKPNITLLKQLDHRGIIVTARGETFDFVSRVFYPKKTIYEDPVTGSSYCLLVPYWSKELNKTEFHASQLSQRGGQVLCQLHENGVRLNGQAIMYMQGTILL